MDFTLLGLWHMVLGKKRTLGVAAHTSNMSTHKAEASGSLRKVSDQPKVHSETPVSKTKQRRIKQNINETHKKIKGKNMKAV